jgi:hypothetical protein
MRRVVVRALVALAGAAGLVAVAAGTAAAGASLNHTEPVLDISWEEG